MAENAFIYVFLNQELFPWHVNAADCGIDCLPWYKFKKKLGGLMNKQGYCVETALANAVVENTKHFQGMYAHPFLKKGNICLLCFRQHWTFNMNLLW